jgi:hypothetical protein
MASSRLQRDPSYSCHHLKPTPAGSLSEQNAFLPLETRCRDLLHPRRTAKAVKRWSCAPDRQPCLLPPKEKDAGLFRFMTTTPPGLQMIVIVHIRKTGNRAACKNRPMKNKLHLKRRKNAPTHEKAARPPQTMERPKPNSHRSSAASLLTTCLQAPALRHHFDRAFYKEVARTSCEPHGL